MKVVVAGATGFIGRALVAGLKKRGHDVRVFSRSPEKAKAILGVTRVWAWDGTDGEAPIEALSGADAVVNLAGEGIGERRWTAKRKSALRTSRIDATRNLVRAIGKARPRPNVLVSGSAIGYYGDRPDGSLDENAAPGHDFLADLCREWEIAASGAEALGLRLVTLRTGVVLGPNGGALAKMLTPFRMGVGGRLGRGSQWMSWIHLDDEVGLIVHALENEDVRGPLNGTAPAPVRNVEFTRALGRALHRPAILPAPGLALKLALGEMAEMLLTGQNVVPKKALATGYRFRHESIDAALRASV